jgi:hypothetical protein
MNESAKTASFVVAAVLAVAAGVWSHWSPAPVGATAQQAVGTSLFADLKPESAKSLEIIEYDDDTATLKPFKVAQENGLWRIPSHDNYPADASQQLGDAAAALSGCEIINIESEDRATHVTYGVIDPDPKSLTAGTTGVGKRVTMEDGSGKKLAQLIIGKGIKDKTDLHFVRIPGQDPVYVVKLKTDKFSTKFEDWIEKDLLKLNSFDIEQVSFNDYSIDELQRALDPRSKIQVAFDSKDSKWKLDDLEVYDREKNDYEPQMLADDEELNSQKLNELKNALDDLKIVDVRRKPEGLAADLRAGEELAKNPEVIAALMQRGFHLAETSDGEKGIFSNEGEIRCGTKEGVEYVLRFGRIAGGSESEKADDETSAKEEGDGEKTDEDKAAGANRFIMVTAQFNEDLIAKPELSPLPGESPAKQDETEGKEEPKDDAKDTSAIESNLGDAAGKLAQADGAPPADDTAAPEDAATEAKDVKAEEKADEPAGEEKSKEPAKKSSKAGKEKSDAKPEIAKPKNPEELARDRIIKENEGKQKDYDEKVKKGREKVKELSDRFADWYYIVSDSTYQKIHLGRDDIVKKKTPPADEKTPGESKADDEHGHDHANDVLKEEDKTLPE